MKKLGYLGVILLSLVYLYGGYRIATVQPYEESLNIDMLILKAKVIEVLNQENISYSDDLIGTNTFFIAEIVSGELKGEQVIAVHTIDPFVAMQLREVRPGDKVLIMEDIYASQGSDWVLLEYIRTDAMMVLALVFAAFLIIFGKWKGVNTLISLTFTCLAIFAVFIPAILNGKNLYVWSILTCLYIIWMTHLIITGFHKKTLAASLGCLSGVLLSGILFFIMDWIIKLTGVINDESVFLQMYNPEQPLDLKAIIFAGIIIGSLGAIMDVAMSIASSLYEIREKSEHISMSALMKSGMNIGQDIMGTMANTLILAYIGSSLSLTLLLIAYHNTLLELFNREMIVIEVLQTLIGSIGILFTIPFTAFLSAVLYSKREKRAESQPNLDLP